MQKNQQSQLYPISSFLTEKVSHMNPSKLSSQHYTHLAVKQITQRQASFDIDFYTPIEEYFLPMNKTGDKILKIMKSKSNKREMVNEIVNEIKQNDPEFDCLKSFIKEQLSQKANNVSQMQSRKNTFAIDCLREVMSYPFKKDKQEMEYNFVAFWKLPLDKEMRRVLWQKSLVSQSAKQEFFKWDHEITPYNIELEFRITLERISQTQGMKLKQLQKDIAIKLLEFTVKRNQILPNRSQLYMVINVVELFNYFNMSRINEIGALFLGLEKLAAFYFQPRTGQRINKILKALELVDQTTYQLFNGYFFQNQDRQMQARMELNEVYQHFRLSLGARYLPFGVSQYLIDQLLIKKKNKFDCYVLFAIVVLVMGDHVEKMLLGSQGQSQDFLGNKTKGSGQSGENIDTNNSVIRMKKVGVEALGQQVTIKSLFQHSKTLIRKEDVVEAFEVVYEKIPATYSSNYELNEPNLLFSYLLNEQQQQQAERIAEDEKRGQQQVLSGRKMPQQEDEQLILMQQLEQLKERS